MKRKVGLIVFCVLMALPLFSQDYSVDFVDGILEKSEGGNWIMVDVGESISQNATIRVGENSIVELSVSGERLTISNPGTYRISDLNSTFQQRESQTGMWSFLKHSVKGMIHGQSKQETSVLGARASEAAKEEVFEWMDEDEEILKQAQSLLKEEKYTEAINLLEEAIDFVADERLVDFKYHIGYAYSVLGESGQALKILTEVSLDSLNPLFEEWVFLTGELLVRSFSYNQALSLFEPYIAAYPEGFNIQPVLFLAGICSGELGNTAVQKNYWKRAVDVDPVSDWGKLAQTYLSQ